MNVLFTKWLLIKKNVNFFPNLHDTKRFKALKLRNMLHMKLKITQFYRRNGFINRGRDKEVK